MFLTQVVNKGCVMAVSLKLYRSPPVVSLKLVIACDR